MQAMTTRVGVGWLVPLVALLVTLNALGGVGGWFAATARLPFVAGLDRYLPRCVRFAAPAAITRRTSPCSCRRRFRRCSWCSVRPGPSVRGAYDVLVSMSIISYFVPFLFMFAALIKVQDEPAAADVMRVPGGRPVAILFGAVGFLTTAVAIVLACVPAADEPNKDAGRGEDRRIVDRVDRDWCDRVLS